MLNHLPLALLLVLAPPQASPAPPPSPQDAPAAVLEAMHWLAGSWEGPMWGGQFVAHYSTPAGGKILSYSQLLRGGQVSFYEFEVFESQGQAVRLQPFPGGRPAVGLTLTSHDPQARRAVFENPDKDYPTRIVYERVTDGALHVVLSDPHGGSDKVERFELTRAQALRKPDDAGSENEERASD